MGTSHMDQGKCEGEATASPLPDKAGKEAQETGKGNYVPVASGQVIPLQRQHEGQKRRG